MREDFDALLVLYLTGRASPTHLARLERLRRASAANDQHYREFIALWRLAGNHAAAQLRGRVPDAASVLAAGPEKDARSVADRGHRTSRPVRDYGLLAAAVVVMLLGVGLAYAALTRSDGEMAIAEFRTGPTELSSVVLEDGTMVRLAPGSTLRVSFEADRRQASLSGRAFFAVSPDPARPFDVLTDDGVVQVLGTRFDLQSMPGRHGTRVLVLDGKVALSTPSGASQLGPGDLAVTSPSSSPRVERVDDPERMLDWMGAWVAFEGTPLRRVVRELEVRLGVSIEIADPAIEERTVVGWFAQDDREEMIDMVCRVADVDCSWMEGQVVMKER